MTTPCDLYDALGVPKDASPEAIGKAYRKLAKRHHPDRGGDRERFEAVDRAYTILSDPERRAHYNATGETKHARADAEHGQVLQYLASAMAQAVKAIIEAGRKPDSEDMVAHMKTSLREALKELGQQEKSAALAVKNLAELVDRFTVADGEENELRAIAVFHLDQAQKSVAQVKQQAERVRKALALLERYQYRFTAKKGWDDVFGPLGRFATIS